MTLSTTLPSRMRAQQLHAYNEAYKLVTDIQVPVPTEPNDILIRVDAASYCHTDSMVASGQIPGAPLSFPHVGSHEFAGTVVAHAENPSPVCLGRLLFITIRTIQADIDLYYMFNS